MIKVKGQNVWPQALDEVILSCPEVEEYNASVIVDKRGREVVQVIVEFKGGVEEKRKAELLPILESRLKKQTGINMQTLEGRPGEVEHFDIKPRRLKDKRQESLAKHVR
jgi:phenylacetate-coenzyme A ligase PaaK-like adenylate-forming protein